MNDKSEVDFMLLFLQVLYTLTGWKWVKTLLGVVFIIDIALTVFGIGIVIAMLPQLMNIFQELVNML